MAQGTAYVLYRDSAPAFLQLRAWWERSDKERFEASQEWVKSQERTRGDSAVPVAVKEEL